MKEYLFTLGKSKQKNRKKNHEKIIRILEKYYEYRYENSV